MAFFSITPGWVKAGNATFTVHNAKGEHYTYKVAKATNEGESRPPAWFVTLLTGPDNESDYSYLGMLNPHTGEVRSTKASKLGPDSKPLRVAQWALKQVWGYKTLPDGYGIHHEGRCARCGRTLTTPASVASGWGPECLKKVGG